MTDIDLLPLPEWTKRDDLGGLVPSEVRVEMCAYARANVARNTALLRAEIKALREQLRLTAVDQANAEAEANDARAEAEALRAEVERLEADSRMRVHMMELAQARAERAEAENERLEEALALLPNEHDMIEHNPDEGPRMFCCGREVKFDWLNGPIRTHDEECWYARMRALREQEKGE